MNPDPIRRHTTAILRAAHTYRVENHCTCGEILVFAPKIAGKPRLCDLRKIGVAA